MAQLGHHQRLIVALSALVQDDEGQSLAGVALAIVFDGGAVRRIAELADRQRMLREMPRPSP